MKITAANNFVESKVSVKEQEVMQTTMPLSSGAKESPVMAKSTNNDNYGEGTNKRDAQAENKRLLSLIDDTNNKLKSIRRRCEYTYNEDVNRIAIKVVDADTNTVIKEIPPEEALESLLKIWEVAGLLVDEKR